MSSSGVDFFSREKNKKNQNSELKFLLYRLSVTLKIVLLTFKRKKLSLNSVICCVHFVVQ